MPEDSKEELPPHDRRTFFSAGLARLLRPLADYIEERLPLLPPDGREHLRPPGALPEDRFLQTCYRCGSCVDACPVDAIIQLKSPDQNLAATPVVNPDLRACTLCAELACMHACPSGALCVVDRSAIRMGLARVEQQLCVRSRGKNCTLCLDCCPLGETAIRLDDRGHVQVIDPAKNGRGCTGCGHCQQYCPTQPVRAIRVQPGS